MSFPPASRPETHVFCVMTQLSSCPQIFKQLFRDALELQRGRLRELRRYTREERARRAHAQQNHIESMEN